MLLPQAAASDEQAPGAQLFTAPLPAPDTPPSSAEPDGPNPDPLASLRTPYTSTELHPAGSTDAAADAGAGAIGRPTGPEVQPCRGLPRPQEIECLLTSGAGR